MPWTKTGTLKNESKPKISIQPEPPEDPPEVDDLWYDTDAEADEEA